MRRHFFLLAMIVVVGVLWPTPVVAQQTFDDPAKVPNGRYYGDFLRCNDGYTNRGGNCARIR